MRCSHAQGHTVGTAPLDGMGTIFQNQMARPSPAFYVLGKFPSVGSSIFLDEQPAAVDVIPLQFSDFGVLHLHRFHRAVGVGHQKIRCVVGGGEPQAAVGIRRLEEKLLVKLYRYYQTGHNLGPQLGGVVALLQFTIGFR